MTGVQTCALPIFLFGHLIQSKSAAQVNVGYLIGAGAMLLGALAELVVGVDAERKPLEDVAPPVSAASAGGQSGTA